MHKSHQWLTCLLLCTALWLAVPMDGLAQGNSAISANWIIGEPPTVDGQPGHWTVGDRIPLRLDLSYPAEAQITVPQLPQRWGEIEIYQSGDLETVSKEAGIVRAVLDLQVIIWATGQWQTPEMEIKVTDPDQQSETIIVEPITIELGSVLPEAAEGEEIAKEDLKPQAEMPLPPWWLWLIAGVALAVVLFFGLRWLIRWWKRRWPKQEEAEPEETIDMRPAHIIALEELDRIAALRLAEQGAFKAHYTLLTDCLKRYVEARYEIGATDCTTTEIAGMLLATPIAAEPRLDLVRLLRQADLIKFAKGASNVQSAHNALNTARQIVCATQPPAISLPENEAQSPLPQASRTEVD